MKRTYTQDYTQAKARSIEAIHLYNQLKSQRRVAEKMGISLATVTRLLKEQVEHAGVCTVCGKGFLTFNPKQITCSITCRQRLNGSKSAKVIRSYGIRKCEYCSKEYTARSDHSKYCSETCRRTANYHRNIDRYRAYDRKRIRRTTIGLNIRNEHLQLKKKQAKWLWDGFGPWSQKYPDITDCVECNTHVFKHSGNGVCEYCHDKLRERDEERTKELKVEWYQRVKEAGTRPKYKEIANQWIGLAEDKKIPITPPINNLLDNLHQLEKES